MKPPRKQTAKKNTHYSWRPSEETRELFEELIEQFPYINKTPSKSRVSPLVALHSSLFSSTQLFSP